MMSIRLARAALGAALFIPSIVAASHGQSEGNSTERAVLARLAEIQSAAQSLDADKTFSFVLENNKGSVIQDGRLLLTRQEALESTRRGFQGLSKVEYQFDQQHVAMLAPTIALVTGEGMTTATTSDGRTFSTPFAQSVVFVQTDGEWKVFHAHRSFPRVR